MAYEVIKRVGKRAYRYRVQSYRDPQTGKSKGTWTYLGRYTGPIERPQNQSDEDSTALRLIDAFEALLQKVSFDTLTIEAITSRAQVSHATFYRHFKNKRAILFAALLRMKQELNPASVLHVTSDAEGEREKLRAFFHFLLNRGYNSGLIRAVLEARFYDPKIQAFYEQICNERLRIWRDYITELNECGLGRDDDPERMTNTLMTFAQGMLNEVSVRRGAVSSEEIDTVADVFGRILFR